MVTYNEHIDSTAPGSAGFSLEGGRATLQQFVTTADLDAAITDILGSTNSGGDGRLVRSLPRAHPRFPWMFASNISDIRGYGKPVRTDAITALEAPTFDQYADYPQYLLTIEFTPRMYPVLSDDAIDVKTTTFYDDSGTKTTPKYASEWLRYTDYEVLPHPEIVTAQQGMMLFRTNSGSAPDKISFAGLPRITIPQATLKFRWYQVPFRYIDSTKSFIVKYIGRINQNSWYGFLPGQLLYTGVSARRYTPPKPNLIMDVGEKTYSTDKLCDLEFQFEYTERSQSDVPTPSNGNWIASGHNLNPWLKNRQFYYTSQAGAVPDTTPSNWVPTFLSFPFELLFTDPDV